MTNTVWPVDAVAGAPNYTGRMLRQTNTVAFSGATSARPLGARSGVRPGTPATTVTTTSTTFTINPHAGLLDLETALQASAYAYSIDAAVTGSVTAANASNPRVDIIYLQLNDPAESDGSSTPGLSSTYYLAGTAAASPVAPATPARAMVLAQLNVPTSGGGSPTVTWVAPYCSAAGAVRNVLTTALLTASTGSYDGELAWAMDTHLLYEWSAAGSAWAVLADPTVFTQWAAYTVLWGTVAGGTCTVGTGGSINGWFKKVGYTVDWEITVITGADATIPSGSALHWSLPTVPNCRGGALKTQVGFGNFLGGSNVSAVCYGESSSAAFFQAAFAGNSNMATSVNPASWLSRTVTFSGRYESTT